MTEKEKRMKRLFAIILIPVAALVLSGCGKPKTDPVQPTTQQQTSATAELPQNPTQAIDSEISNMDQEIDSVTEEIDSTELTDEQFGL